ncbi:TIR-like protein FxsC [Actinoplanes sp. RD1]|uniref:TIR-like protein FxsC n=1 Tax=Actinoplanes sp. RD1 TaxID=3064538 RepID=UPI002740F4E2|nr:TIR-like protein FxsC [Actinoplanes sp. RD1]
MPEPPPRFFISYVHHSAEDNRLVEKFFLDLCNDVQVFSSKDDGTGFCDTSLQLGDRWSDGLVEALSTAQVFLPLLSPSYFRSEACGKEWTVFESRIAPAGRSTSIIPLLWVPMDTLHPVADRYQYREAAFGDEYERVRLRRLIRGAQAVYNDFVQVLAQRVVELSTGRPVPPATDRPGFHQIASAFAATRRPPTAVPPRPRNRAPRPPRRDLPLLNPNLPEDQR